MKYIKSLIIIALCTIACSKPVQQQPVSVEHDSLPLTSIASDIKLELPGHDNSVRIINHMAYSIGYSDSYREALWVAYKLTAEMLNVLPRVSRADKFVADPLLPVELAVTDVVYKKSGFDRGHLLPAADMAHSELTMKETFYFSNITPQVPTFNRGIWKVLEDQVREWAKKDGKIYVVTGPVLSSNLKMLNGTLPIPEVFYKGILFYSAEKVYAIGFLMENEGSTKPLQSFAVTIDRIEEETSLDLFYQLPDVIEKKVEAEYDLAEWSL